MSNVIAILAMDENGGIGLQNELPWPKNAKDMQWFKESTVGHSVVMGRKTWESLGCKKLPHRLNYVLSNGNLDGEPDYIMYGGLCANTEYMLEVYPDNDIFIIGGAEVYEQALPYCDEVYLTTFKSCYECDTYIDLKHLEDFTVSENVYEDSEIKIEILKRGS